MFFILSTFFHTFVTIFPSLFNIFLSSFSFPFLFLYYLHNFPILSTNHYADISICEFHPRSSLFKAKHSHSVDLKIRCQKISIVSIISKFHNSKLYIKKRVLHLSVTPAFMKPYWFYFFTFTLNDFFTTFLLESVAYTVIL